MSCCRFYFRNFFHLFLFIIFIPLFCHFLQLYVYYGSPLSSVVISYSTNYLYSFHFIFCLFCSSSIHHDHLQYYPFYFLLLWRDFLSTMLSFFSCSAFSRPPIIVLSLLFELLYPFIWVPVLKIPCFILNASSSQRCVCLKLLLFHIIFLLYILLFMFLTSFKKCDLSITSNWLLSNYYSFFNGGYLNLRVC